MMTPKQDETKKAGSKAEQAPAKAPEDHDDDLDSIGGASTGTHNTTADYEDKESIEIAKKESKQILYTRTIVLLVLVSVATAVCLAVYFSSSVHEEDVFHEHFEQEAMKLQSEFQGSASRCVEALESVSNQITAYAISSNSVWPNVVVPEFERRTKYAMEVSDVQSIVFYPIVSEADRASWEMFSFENQGWLEEGLAVQKVPEEDWNRKNIEILENIWGVSPWNEIPSEIFRFEDNSTAPETGPGPYAPWWQFAPAFPVPSIVNHNGISHPSKDQAIQSVIASKEPLLTRAWDYSNYDDPTIVDKRAVLDLFIEHAVGGHKDYSNFQHGPASNLYVPIFESYDDDAAVVGVLASYLDWQDFLEDVLLADDVGVIVVLENTCDQQFTYRLDGYKARYVGAGDLHDSNYDFLKIVIDLGKFVEFEGDRDDLPVGQCLYHASVYASADNEAQLITDEPRNFAIILACTFLFTCSVFLLYDYLVERRQKLVLTSAVRSESMVASLFPKGVRDRLYKEDEQQQAEAEKKSRGKNVFLTSAAPALGSDEQLEDGCKAIADLYPNCTVCFMDIVGFTQWSSTREPWQVFKLLETMYKTFDKIAKRLVVFKVETIGDCYVAVTGIPHAQPDHAVIMATFATECVLRLGRILNRLVNSLGPETETLRLRVGMHSGPVTAGVLRGAKARFQLFGDTVNTAARMESTGAPSKIQLSSDTAAALIAADKEHWLQKRKEEVLAKGKGSLQTYWLQAHAVDCSRAGSFTTGDITGESSSNEPGSSSNLG